jgi:hypothetical protein
MRPLKEEERIKRREHEGEEVRSTNLSPYISNIFKYILDI